MFGNAVTQNQSIKDLLLMSLLEQSAEIAWIRDLHVGSFFVFATAENRLKFSVPDVINEKFWTTGIHPEDIEATITSLESGIEDQNIPNLVLDYRRIIGGRTLYIQDKIRFVRNEDRVATKIIGIWHDITLERGREKTLRKALQYQFSLNEELARREENLRMAEEKLLNTNQQILSNNKQLLEREFILEKSQQVAGIGNWEYNVSKNKLFFSEEMYSIYGIDPSIDISDGKVVAQLFVPGSLEMVTEALTRAINNLATEFDLYCEVITPLGYRKTLRVVGYMDSEGGNRVIGLTYDVTYVKEAALRLKSSEEKFAKAFGNHPDLIMIIREKDRVVVDLNDKVSSVLGYSRSELAGHDIAEFNLFVHREERDNFLTRYETSSSLQLEVEWRRKNGTIIYVVLSTIRIEVEATPHFLIVVRDTSEIKVAEAKFQKAFEGNPDVMVIVREADGILVEVNDKIKHITGYDRADVVGKEVSTFPWWISPEDKRNKEESLFEKPIRRKDGSTFFATHAFSGFSLAGEKYLIATIRDVTERTMFQNRILLNEANLNAIINNTKMLIFSIDRSYRVITLNLPAEQYARDVYGMSIVAGNSLDSKHLPEKFQIDVFAWRSKFRLAFRGHSFNAVAQLHGKSYSISFNPITERSIIRGVSVFAEDITDRVSKEQELSSVRGRIAELRLVALRSAMNPHFIFNALNSIQYFMAKNDRVNAMNYLSTFSKLIRKILESSINTRVRLSDELELLNHYINLELVRFDHKFSFEFSIDEVIDPQLVRIPSLLIQPYVENAILHGLNGRKDQGHLTVAIKRSDANILVVIEDNGIGRRAASEVKKNAGVVHRSFGSELTAERLQLINSDNNVSVHIDDLFQGESAAGTRVTITVSI